MDYAETLFEAVDVLVDKKIESVKFDETITATIVDASDAKSGKYLVSNGSAKFVAYSTVTNYRERDSVLVTIPQGNYDNQKIIVSKVLENENVPLVYTSPFERIINLTSNVIAGAANDSYYIWANGNDYSWEHNQSITEYIASLDDENREYPLPYLHMENLAIQGYTALGLRAQFATHLLDYNTISGNYGIIAKLIFDDGSVAEYLTFDCNEFFGNPYNYETYFTLSKVFDITNYENQVLTDIYLYPYQRNNFTDADGERIPSPDNSGNFFNTIPANIFIKDPYICFGTFVEQFNGDTAQLFTSDLNYTLEDENLTRNLTLQWIHQDEESGQVAVVENATIPENYEIRWYRYHFGSPSPDSFVEAHWDRMESRVGYKRAVTFNSEMQYYTLADEIYSLAQGITAENFAEGEYYEQYDDVIVDGINATITLDSSLATEQFKVVIVKVITPPTEQTSGTYPSVTVSNIITFSNLDEIVDIPINYDLFYIYFNDDEKGHYFIYDESGEVGKNEDTEPRELVAYFDGVPLSTSDHTYSDLEWTFPEGNTMISRISGMGAEDNRTAFFSIKKHLNHNASNNTIKLKGIIDGIEYVTTARPLFGTAGTNGSNYKLVIDWEDYAYDVTLNNPLKGKVYLYDQAGDSVVIPTDAEISCEWQTAYVQGTSSAVKEIEDRDLFYPVFSNINESLIRGGANSDQPDYFYYFVERPSDNPTTTYYYFDINQNTFVEGSNYKTIYRKKKDGESKKKLTFVPVTFTDDPLDHETGTVTNGINGNAVSIRINNGVKEYYFQPNQYYVKFNDIYIIDPWTTYDETETYYEPYEVSASTYGSVAAQQLTAAASFTTEENIAGKFWTITISKKDENVPVSINSLYILKVTLSKFGDYDLTECYPIALKQSSETFNPRFIEGPDEVRYDSSGETDFDKNPYQIVAVDNNNFIGHGYLDGSYTGLTGYWKLFLSDNTSNFLPQLTETATEEAEVNGENVIRVKPVDDGKYDIPLLSPISIYIPREGIYGVQFYHNDAPIWTQPILVYENNYPSRTLNKWNGKEILTDEGAGTITASGFSAGKKERDNTFTGVVLGDWSRSVADAEITKTTGIYGFNHGAMSYAFKDDGTGFIGKDGSGRIYFDGNKSQIYSNQWRGNNEEGMLLDIDDGYIKMQKEVDADPDNYVQFSTDPNSINSYFTRKLVKNNNSYSYAYNLRSGEVIYSRSGNVYSAIPNSSTDYTYNEVRQLYYNAINGADGYITLGANQPNYPLSIGRYKNISLRPFKVNWEGKTWISDGEFSGIINATGGTIDGDLTVNSTLTGGVLKTDALEATRGTIGGWTIGDGLLTNGQDRDSSTTILEGISGRIYSDVFTVSTYGKYSTDVLKTANFGLDVGRSDTSWTDVLGLTSTGSSLVLRSNDENVAIRAAKSIYLQSHYDYESGGSPQLVVGSGTNSKNILFQFKDGAGTRYEVTRVSTQSYRPSTIEYPANNFYKTITAGNNSLSLSNPLGTSSERVSYLDAFKQKAFFFLSGTAPDYTYYEIFNVVNTGDSAKPYEVNVYKLKSQTITTYTGGDIYVKRGDNTEQTLRDYLGISSMTKDQILDTIKNTTMSQALKLQGYKDTATGTDYYIRIMGDDFYSHTAKVFLGIQDNPSNQLVFHSGEEKASFYFKNSSNQKRHLSLRSDFTNQRFGLYDHTIDEWIISVNNASVWIGDNTAASCNYSSDYAESRKNDKTFLAGSCIKEDGKDKLEITTKRLEKSCWIISDTYGFLINSKEENDKVQIPIAVAGRVLAYPYESIEEFANHIGDPVCSGPNGTVSIMTGEEERMYPSRILGTIASIPQEETFGNVEVNGRVWIKIL